MNIFFLHLNQQKCAKWHVDKHVIKMILESIQLLCSAHHVCPNKNNSYKPVYKLRDWIDINNLDLFNLLII